MVEVTIEITQYCPNNCDYCSSNASTIGQYLDMSRIFKFLVGVMNKATIDRINISGGEPLSHPDFYDILTFCYNITDNVWVYTNAIKNIIFNADILDEVNVEANLCLVGGKWVHIPRKVDRLHILKLIHQGRAKNLPRQNITVSSNFFKECNKDCNKCKHILLQADGQIVTAPCKKRYKI